MESKRVDRGAPVLKTAMIEIKSRQKADQAKGRAMPVNESWVVAVVLKGQCMMCDGGQTRHAC